MESTKVVFQGHASGEVQLFTDDLKVGKMNIALTKGRLAVYHTEVSPAYEGRGFAKLLLNQLVNYAKENDLRIIPLCPYVSTQFSRHPAAYEDVWFKDWHQ